MSNHVIGSRADHPVRDSLPGSGSAVAAMYVGLALTVFATIVPFVDRVSANVLADHLRAGYPGYSRARIDTAVMTYLVLLSAVGVLGIVGWAVATRAVRTGRRWARIFASLMFVLGAGVALTGLLIRDTSGDTGLPPLFGWTAVLPSIAGLVAVVLLWRVRDRPPGQVPSRSTSTDHVAADGSGGGRQ